MENIKETLLMAEAIPRLAVAMSSALSEAKILVVGKEKIEIRFNGLPSLHVTVFRRLLSNQFQIIESQVDLYPECLAMLSLKELQRLAASENLGLHGVTVLPLHPDLNSAKAGLRIRAGFVGQKGRTADEAENLAIDILNTTAFARTLEDRVTENTVGSEFSFELYQSRRERRGPEVRARFVAHGQHSFAGSTERVFEQILKTLRNDFHFEVMQKSDQSATIHPPGQTGSQPLQIATRIPSDTPIFTCHAPLMKLPTLKPEVIWSILADLNTQIENGHFSWNPADQVLAFTSWKHLTNDLRNFSFDHVVFSASNALALALDTVQSGTVVRLTPASLYQASSLKRAA